MAAKARLRLDGADPINQGLVARWVADGTTAGALRDISPRRLNAALSGGPVRVPGQDSLAVRMVPASSQYGQAVNNAPMLQAFSVVARIRPNFSSSYGTQTVLFSRYSGGTQGMRIVWPNASLGWYFHDIAGGGGIAYATNNGQGAFAAGDWCDIGLTVVRAAGTLGGSVQYWWAGKKVTTTYIGGAGWPSSDQSAYPFYTGQDGDSSGYWNGDIATLAVFDRVISDNSMRTLMRDPWAGTARGRRVVAYAAGTQYSLATDPLSYEHTVGDAALLRGRTLDTGALAYEHTVGDADFIVRRTLAADAVAYGYRVPTVGLSYVPAPAEGDTHDGFVRRSRRQRAQDAAEKRRRDDLVAEAVALRLSLEAAMGEAAEATEDVPEPVAEAVETATRAAARYVPRLLAGPAPEVMEAAHKAVVALRSAIAAADRARMLAEDDEDVLMLLRAL